MKNSFNKMQKILAAAVFRAIYFIAAAIFFISLLFISDSFAANEKSAGNLLEKARSRNTSRKPYSAKNLSSEEIELADKISKEFDKLASGEFQGRDIFFAVCSARDSKLIFASDEKFYKDKAISPGSLIKIISAGILLEEPEFSPARLEFCGDKTDIGGIRFTCSYKGGHGNVDLETAVSRSCNLYFQKSMRAVARKKFAGTLKDLGIINDKDAANILAAPDYLYYQAVIGDALVYTTAEKLLKLMRAIAVNFSTHEPFYGARPFSYENCQKINGYLRKTVESGTAAAKLSGFDCAGKTGSPVLTVEIGNNKRVVTTSAVFLGYTPYIEPEYCFFAYCARGMGGAEAADIAGHFIDFINSR
ncbi:MAG TPA: penicillin-binding transpeptidase domain-containing protein [Candidatus Wallbacteria bacterium]|nr:penicillin-binding transpeptidase domain-containing protein [Candidatus Wallbacteria bacterium]